jgi:AhpD family alkylhydroperoxidase
MEMSNGWCSSKLELCIYSSWLKTQAMMLSNCMLDVIEAEQDEDLFTLRCALGYKQTACLFCRQRGASNRRSDHPNLAGGITMEPRIDYLKVGRGVYEAMLGLEKYLGQCGLDETLLDLIKLRVSQINGCAYCLDIHWKDLRARGESEQRLYGLDAWEESPYYNERERAALALG